MDAPRTKPSPALPALTGARFFAALWVVIYHYGMESVGAAAQWLVTLPDAARDLFDAIPAERFRLDLSSTQLRGGTAGKE